MGQGLDLQTGNGRGAVHHLVNFLFWRQPGDQVMHPGIETIVAEAAKINPHIHFIAGGLHLVVAQDAAIEKAATSLHDSYKVDYIAPGHCTGEPTFAALQRMFGDRYLYAGLGTTLGVGAVPRAESDRGAALNEDDLRSYRMLLASSDDFKGSISEAVRLAQVQY